MGSPAELGGAATGPGRESGDERSRVEELLRVNERLAAEVRSLALGRTEQPRSSATTAARRLGALREERDALAERLEAATAELADVRRNRDELERHRVAIAAELVALRAGWRGLLRRCWARLPPRR